MNGSGKEALIKNMLSIYGFKLSSKQVSQLIRAYNNFEMPISQRMDNIIQHAQPFISFIQTILAESQLSRYYESLIEEKSNKIKDLIKSEQKKFVELTDFKTPSTFDGIFKKHRK